MRKIFSFLDKKTKDENYRNIFLENHEGILWEVFKKIQENLSKFAKI